MKGIVVYYSATGNTSKIAQAICRGMQQVIECDVAPLKKADPQALTRYDVIALGAPMWYFREPANVRLFIYNMPNLDSTHARLAMRVEAKDNHPFVKLLAEAEAQGRFRRLTPLDQVGWDNPVYKNPNHPRFVIEEE